MTSHANGASSQETDTTTHLENAESFELDTQPYDVFAFDDSPSENINMAEGKNNLTEETVSETNPSEPVNCLTTGKCYR